MKKNGNVRVNEQNIPQAVNLEPLADKQPVEIVVLEEGGFKYNGQFLVCTDKNGNHVLADAPRILMTTLESIAQLLRFKRVPRLSLTPYFGEHLEAAVKL